MKVFRTIALVAACFSRAPHSVDARVGVDISVGIDASFAETACQEFPNEAKTESGWTFDDCVRVWNSWSGTLQHLPNIATRYDDDVELFRNIAAEQRRRGSPCLVQSPDYPDGAGSLGIRHLITWVILTPVADEMQSS